MILVGPFQLQLFRVSVIVDIELTWNCHGSYIIGFISKQVKQAPCPTNKWSLGYQIQELAL